MSNDISNLQVKHDDIIHVPSISRPNYGLAIEGTTWSIDHEGTANFTSLKINNETLNLSEYIPNEGNTESNTDFTLSRKSMFFRGGSFAFGLPNADPYITFNPGSFNLSSQGEVNISSTGQAIINGGISLRLVGSSNIQLATSLNNPTQYIQLSGGKFEVKTSSGSLYLNDHFTYEGTLTSNKIKLNITDTFAYSDITNNTTNYAFNIGSSTLQFSSTKYNLQLTPNSFVVETKGYSSRASINIGSSVFSVNSYNSATNYGSFSFTKSEEKDISRTSGNQGGNPPNASGNPPNASGNPPNASGNPPNGSGNPPNGSGNPPNASGNPPNASGNPPNGSGNPPNASGNPPNASI